MKWQQIEGIPFPWTWEIYQHKREKHLKFYTSPSKKKFAYWYDNSIYAYYLERANPIITKIYLKIFTKKA